MMVLLYIIYIQRCLISSKMKCNLIDLQLADSIIADIIVTMICNKCRLYVDMLSR